jgi:hypothetical protein
MQRVVVGRRRSLASSRLCDFVVESRPARFGRSSFGLSHSDLAPGGSALVSLWLGSGRVPGDHSSSGGGEKSGSGS